MITPQHLRILAESHAETWLVYGTDLLDLVDVLQEFAEQTGLVAAFGQDMVQQLIAAPFAIVRAEIDAEAALRPGGDIDPGLPAREYRTPQATIDAFKHIVRLGNPETIKTWLRDHPKDTPALRKALLAEAA